MSSLLKGVPLIGATQFKCGMEVFLQIQTYHGAKWLLYCIFGHTTSVSKQHTE